MAGQELPNSDSSLSRCPIMHKKTAAMHVKECEHMIPQNIYIITPPYGHITRKEVQYPTTPFPAESPHTITWEGWFMVLTVNFGS